MSKRSEDNKCDLYCLGGSETLGSYLLIQPCSDISPQLSKCSIQWYRVSPDGSQREAISGICLSQVFNSNSPQIEGLSFLVDFSDNHPKLPCKCCSSTSLRIWPLVQRKPANLKVRTIHSQPTPKPFSFKSREINRITLGFELSWHSQLHFLSSKEWLSLLFFFFLQSGFFPIV